MKFPSLLPKNRLVGLLCAGLVSLAAAPFALATDLPPGVLNYLRQKDPHVKVRFDGVVLFSNGESYVPVIPQDPSVNPDSQQVTATIPEKAAYPDLIQFDNNFFLMRLVQTSSGRLTFPKLADYPIQLKEGLLPQDFVMPSNLYIPVELKVILGALPYSPSYSPTDKPALTPAATVLRNAAPPNGAAQVTSHVTYVFDLEGQKIVAIDPVTGREQGTVDLDGVPANLRVSPDGKLLFVPCLSSNELVVVDTGSNLVKTRIPVGQRPDAVLYLDQAKEVVVSNRYSPFLSVIDATKLTGAQQVNLPGNGGALALVPGTGAPKLVVADAFNSQLYLVDLNTLTVEKTFKALPDISAVKAFRDTKGRLEIWAVSRTEDKLVLLDGATGNILKTMDVGEKPVDMVAYNDKLFVVSAGDNRIDVINRLDQSKYATIPLETDSFPSGMVLVPTENRAYVTLAAAHQFAVVNLDTLQVDSTLPVDFRAGMIAMTPDKRMLEQETATVEPAQLGNTAASLERKSSGQITHPETAQKESKKRQKAAKSNDSNETTARRPLMPAQSQSLPGEASGKFHFNLGRNSKAKPGTPVASPGNAQPAQAVEGRKSASPVAAPLDLQVAEPSPVANPKRESTDAPRTQDDLVK